jgi:hypothetical protein
VVVVPRLVSGALMLHGRRDSARVREVRCRDLFHRSAGLHEGGAAPLLLGDGARIALAVFDMLALHAGGADERLAGTRLCERQDERSFLAHNLRFASVIAPVIASVVLAVIASVWVVLGNWMMRHLGLRRESDPPALRANRLHPL